MIIVTDDCNKCGDCLTCPHITMGDYKAIVVDTCTNCNDCIDTCPNDAIYDDEEV